MKGMSLSSNDATLHPLRERKRCREILAGCVGPGCCDGSHFLCLFGAVGLSLLSSYSCSLLYSGHYGNTESKKRSLILPGYALPMARILLPKWTYNLLLRKGITQCYSIRYTKHFPIASLRCWSGSPAVVPGPVPPGQLGTATRLRVLQVIRHSWGALLSGCLATRSPKTSFFEGISKHFPVLFQYYPFYFFSWLILLGLHKDCFACLLSVDCFLAHQYLLSFWLASWLVLVCYVRGPLHTGYSGATIADAK